MAATESGLSQLTLLELAKRLDPGGDIADIAETLTENNEMLLDAVWVEANGPTSHRHSQRLTEPSGTWKLVNKGIDDEASRSKQVDEGLGILASYSTVDRELVRISGNGPKFRATEDKAFEKGLNKTISTAVWYGNIGANPEQINGFGTRYASLVTNRIVGQAGSGSDLTSAWLINWGEDKVHFIYPKGTPVGFNAEDLGLVTALDADSKPYQAYRKYYEWHLGIAVRDDRHVGRLCNMEAAAITATSNAFDPNDVINILNHMPEGRGRGCVMYVNPTVSTMIDIQALDKSNAFYTVKDIFGIPTTMFRGYVPIRISEKLVDTETALS